MAGELPGPPVADLIGMRMTEVEPGRVIFELETGPQHASPLGTVHGGIVCDLADAALNDALGFNRLDASRRRLLAALHDPMDDLLLPEV